MKKLLFLALLASVSVFGQEHISGFNMMSLTYKISPKWTAYAEAQTRSRKDYSVIDYYEMKGGAGYNLSDNHQIFLGLGRYGTYEKMKISQEEFRLWLQYTISHRLGKLKLDHRARAEQRYFYARAKDEHTKGNRYRYRLSATLPLNREKVEANTVFLNGFEELFFGPQEPTLKRNRTFGGFGYQFNRSFSTTAGYMFQREFSTRGNSNLHFLYFALNFTIDRGGHGKDIEVIMAD